jgi:hypothetical protein
VAVGVSFIIGVTGVPVKVGEAILALPEMSVAGTASIAAGCPEPALVKT